MTIKRYIYIAALADYFNLGDHRRHNYTAMKKKLLEHNIPVAGVNDNKIRVEDLGLVVKHLL